MGATIWYSSASGSKGSRSRTWTPLTFFETAQPLLRASSMTRSASAMARRDSSVSVVASHSTS